MNAPRPLSDYAGNTIFSAFSGRSPKTLDPQVSYSNDESFYTYAVYEPLLGYHYLKRPYEIVPKTVTEIPTPDVLPDGRTRYRFTLRDDICYAPHPAFAKDAEGRYRYHRLSDAVARDLKNPLALPEKATRTLSAEDYVYGIKRLADPRVVSPVLSVVSDYLPGLKTLNAALRRDIEAAKAAGRPAPDLLDYA